jgi:membrane protein DedA with SNARE-associated domain
LGTPIGYLIGRIIGKKVLNLLLKPEWIDSASNMFKRNGESAILIGSFTPIPFKVFTILSGSLEFSLLKLLLFAAIGRAFKFYAVGILFHFYGSSAKYIIDNYLTLAFLGVALFLTLVLVIKRKIQQKKSFKIMMEESIDTSGKNITNTGEPTLPN